MKKSPIAIALATALTVGLSAPVLAETSQSSSPSASEQGATGTQMQQDTSTQMKTQEGAGSSMGSDTGTSAQTEQSSSTKAMSTAYNPKDYDGKDVINAKGDKVGEVEKLVVSTGDQQVYAVVGVGGFLGIGEKDVAIPLEQLQPQGDKLALSSGITEDELKNSMKYNESEFSAFEPGNGGAQDQPAAGSTEKPIERDNSAHESGAPSDSAPKSNY